MFVKKEKSSYERKIFKGFFIVSMVSLVIVAIGGYSIYQRSMKERTDITMEAMAAQVEYKIDTVVDNVKKYYTEAAASAKLLELCGKNGQEVFYQELVEPLKLLKGPGYLTDFIKGFTFINKKEGWIVSNRGLYEWKDLINADEVSQIFQLMEQGWGNSGKWNISQIPPNPLNRREVNLSGISWIEKIPLISKQTDCIMIVNLDFDSISQLIQEGMGDYGVTVLDQNGSMIFSNEKAIAEYCMDQPEVVRQKVGLFSIREESAGTGKQMRVCKRQSDSSGWNYLISFNMDPVMEGADGILLLGGITAGSICIALALALILSRRMYSPVEKLMDKAKNVRNELTDEKNEFVCISTAMDKLVQDKQDLQAVIRGQKHELRNLFFQKLISGDISPKEVQSQKIELEIISGPFWMLMATAVRNSNDMPDGGIEKEAALIGAAEQMRKIGGDSLACDPILTGDLIFTVVRGNTVEQMQEMLMGMHRRLGEIIQATYRYTIYSGISRGIRKVEELSSAYNECLEAIRNNEILKKQNGVSTYDRYDLVFYSEMNPQKSAVLYCDSGYGKMIRDSVDSGDRENAFAVTDAFIDDLIQRKIMFHEQYVSLYGYLVEILSVANRAGISANAIFEKESSSVFNELGALHDLEEIRKFYKYQVIVPVMEYLQSYRSGMVGNVLNQVLELIEQEKGNLTLTECAERLGHHPSYIWKVMTGCMNITYSDYIQNYKLKEAKRLLVETNLPIVEIAVRLHYTSAQNFNRFFTKHEGMTPGKYRKMNQ